MTGRKTETGKFAFVLSFFLAAVSVFSGPVAAATHGGTFSPDQRKSVEEIVRDFILKNPEIIIQSIQTLQKRDSRAQDTRVQKFLTDRRMEIAYDPYSYVGGNPQGDVTLVEFFDYQCGFCKRVHPTVQTLLKEDGNIRLVYKEFPILGPASVYAARAAIASIVQGKYLDFHNAMMELKGPLTEGRVIKTAKAVGLDTKQLRATMEGQKEETARILQLNNKLAEGLDVNGTPAFVAGDIVIRGAADMGSFKRVISQVRSAVKPDG